MTREFEQRTIVHLRASSFFGGPERQMLYLARALPADHRTVFMVFPEGGRGRPFLDEIDRAGFEGVALTADAPHFRRMIRELAGHLERVGADVLCCHGYKANLLGRPAARRAGIPAVAVARGWTGENLRVRLYDAVDRFALPWMDHIVAVSEGQAVAVRRAGVPAERVTVIRNAIRAERFATVRPEYRELLRQFFPEPPPLIVGAAGRLTPDKGFHVLVEAVARVCRQRQDVGFVLFGEGAKRDALMQTAHAAGLAGRFVHAGFRRDLDAFMPHFDLFVLPSFNEGLPNVILEAFAAGVPVVATAVFGTPEVVEDGVSGYLVPAGDAAALEARILQALGRPDRRALGARGRERVLRDFTFEAQALHYQRFFDGLGLRRPARAFSGRAPRLVAERVG